MKKRINLIALLLSLVLSVFFIVGCDNKSEQICTTDRIEITSNEYSLETLSKECDYLESTKDNTQISAYSYTERDNLSGYINTNMVETENVRIAYNAEYVSEEDLIYVAISTFDENENLLSVETLIATPYSFDDGTIDAKIVFQGKEVYLSEILSGNQENCFFLSALFGAIFAAKLVAVLTVAVKVTVVVAAVVTVGSVTYKLIRVSKEWIDEKAREKEEAKKKTSNPAIYYYARSVGEKLQIAAVPESINAAKNGMARGKSYWTPHGDDARKLCIAFAGTAIGPEIDIEFTGMPKKGWYYHYHPYHSKPSLHAWYWKPYASVY